MNDWMDDLISRCLADIPRGKYRDRTEKELRDHMRTLYLSLTESGMGPDQAREEALRAMGEPDRLQEEYRAAWRAWQRTLPGRLEGLAHLLKAWAVGFAVMFGGQLLIASAVSFVWGVAIALPGDSTDPQIRMIRDTFGNLNNSLFFTHLLPFGIALILGAFYLSYKFRASRHPMWQISVGLSFYWAFLTTVDVWWEALDDHRTFWEEFRVYVSFNAVYYSLTLALCVLLGVVFGYMAVKRRRLAAA